MDETFLILVCDPDSKTWNIVTQTNDRAAAHEEHETMLSDGTRTILICTDDFVQV